VKHSPECIVSTVAPSLGALRSQIDRVDNAILDLLEERYALTRRVLRAKAGENAHALPVRPERERAILARLSARTIQVPAADIAQVWGSILSLSAQAQKAFRVMLWSPEGTGAALARLATSRYGSTTPVVWAADVDEAIAAARVGDTILLMPADLVQPSEVRDLDLIGQFPLDCLHHPWAVALGKLAGEAKATTVAASPPLQAQDSWVPSSWKKRIHQQLPAYPNKRSLDAVEARLASAPGVVEADAIDALTAELADAQQGRRLVIQAGDCAESIAAPRSYAVDMAALVHRLADRLAGPDRPVIRMGRLAGQYGKPRSAWTEGANGACIPVYRGDAVNCHSPLAAERVPSPDRLHEAYLQSCRVNEWLTEERSGRTEAGCKLFTSHEALLLPYEAALTRRACSDSRWMALSAHSVWLGDRTRDLDGAHVEYLRGIANPIGIKCGPSMEPAQLLALLDRLNPERTPGRIMLIARLGNGRVATHLAPLMTAVRYAKHPVLWLCDPMHGNNRSVDGKKSRLLADIVSEVRQFAMISRSNEVHPGGLHLEVTPAPVVECVDNLVQADPRRRYDSLCDPRLNAGQAMHVIDAFADAIEGVR